MPSLSLPSFLPAACAAGLVRARATSIAGPIVVLEVSSTGLLIQVPQPVRLDSLHTVQLTLPGRGGGSVTVAARTIFCHSRSGEQSGPYVVGLSPIESGG